MDAKQPKILVFSVGAWNSKCGPNTWASLLEQYDSENIANICIRDEVPDNPVCSNYFAISENKVIKSIFNRKIKTGKTVEAKKTLGFESADLAEHNKRYGKMKKRRHFLMLLAREIVWKLGVWKTPELDLFLDEFKPDIIFHSMEGYIHLDRIIEYAIDRTGAKAAGFIWDDNFTYKQSSKLGYKFYRFFQRKALKKLAKKTDMFFAISGITKKEADAFFGIDSKPLTKPLNEIPTVRYGEINKPIKLLYTGKLSIGREKTLLSVCEAALSFGGDFVVDVYTSTDLSPKMRKKLEQSGCRFHDPITQNEILKKQKEADVLLFLEAIDGPNASMARLSFSAKITDYLSAGKCILAVGCENTAPMQYFIQHGSAVIARNRKEIYEKLALLSSDNDMIIRYAHVACETGKANHSREKIGKVIRTSVSELLK